MKVKDLVEYTTTKQELRIRQGLLVCYKGAAHQFVEENNTDLLDSEVVRFNADDNKLTIEIEGYY